MYVQLIEEIIFLSAGGFEDPTIFNEDMIFAGKRILAGDKVAYVAEAKVIHSHNYTGSQQFHRNFDLAVSQAQHPEVFEGVPSEGEGNPYGKSDCKIPDPERTAFENMESGISVRM